MAAISDLEKSLETVFVKQAPALPERGKEVLVEWLPWVSLVVGVLTLWSAYALWHWAHLADSLINDLNQLSQVYGVSVPSVHQMSASVWLAVLVLAAEGALFLMAFNSTRARQKRGWDLMFYALLVNLVYGVVVMFTDYGGVGNFIGYAVGSVVGLWLLFQIRGKYLSKKATPAV